jgi:glucoamylase
LLTGERGHYALSSGGDPYPYLRSMLQMSGKLGLIPEQIWDGPALPERGLFAGRPSGSAMPLAWAHAELVKLAVSAKKGFPVDRPEPVWLRYAGQRPKPERAHWTPQMPVSTIEMGLRLLVYNDAPFQLEWSTVGSGTQPENQTAPSTPTVLGLHAVNLPTQNLTPGSTVAFAAQAWSGQRYEVRITETL